MLRRLDLSGEVVLVEGDVVVGVEMDLIVARHTKLAQDLML